MSNQTLYEKLVKKSAMMFGSVPGEERAMWAVEQLLSEDDLRIYFLIPFGKTIPLPKLQRLAGRLGFNHEQLDASLDKMFREAFVMRHEEPESLAYESCPLSMTAEQQVRMKKGTPIGKAFGDYWLSLASISAYKLPTKTPYFRVMAAEPSIHQGEKVRIPIKHDLPEQSQVLPLDVVSDLVRQQKLIGLADCYCRLSADMQGDHCEKPRQTCFVFNEFAASTIALGIARPLELEEALRILAECEKAGLIHNADNFQGQIRGLCNCCACHCPGIKAAAAGKKNVQAVSRYRVVFDPQKCIQDYACVHICPVHALSEDGSLPVRDNNLCLGCGLCVSACPEGALHMEIRPRAPAVPQSPRALQNALMREVIVGMVVSKIRGKG